MTTTLTRRSLMASTGIAATVLTVGAPPSARAADSISFSYQLSSALLLALKLRGNLASSLSKHGFDTRWAEFSRIVSAMSTNSVDFHGDVADAVPIFAQSAGAPLTYYAMESASPHAEALIVAENSPIRSVADLRGKTVAVSKGSGCHFLLLQALKRARMQFTDIVPAYLEAADGSAAFHRGAVDAWVIWDPYLAITQNKLPVRILADGEGLSSYNRYYMVGTAFARKHPELVQVVFDALREAGVWLRADPGRAAALLAPVWGSVPVEVIKIVNARRSYKVLPVDPHALAEQQTIADAFAAAHLVPGVLDVRDAPVWRPAAPSAG